MATPTATPPGSASTCSSRVPLPDDHAHLFDAAADDAWARGNRLRRATSNALCGGVLDVVHLGLGDDGHTASWPPGDPVVDITDRDVAVAGPFNGHLRLTLTVPAVNRARHLVVLVEGAAKAPVVRKLLDGDTSIPASHLRRSGITVLADEAAASAVGPG